MAGLEDALERPWLPFFVAWRDPTAFPGATPTPPAHVAGLEIACDIDELSTWLGPHSLPLDVRAGNGGVTAVVLNVTVTEAQAPGYVTLFPCGASPPTASNLNYVAGSTIPNLVVVKVGDGGRVCIYTQSTVHLVADVSGYFYIGVCDHVALPESVVGNMGTHWMEPISTLSWLAAHTRRVGLLTHVYVLPYRHPLIAAKQFANLDYISGGRAIAGVGAGHAQAEFAALGLDFHSRGKTVDASLPVMISALENEFVDGVGARPRPVQSPRPPVWVAGSSPAAIRRAARLGDGWLPQGPSDRSMVEMLRQELDLAGRSDRAMTIGHITPFLFVGQPSWDVGSSTITGRAEAIAEQVLAGTAEGVNQLQVRFKARSCEELCEQMTVFASEVAPLLC